MATESEALERISCRSYTHGRRHPQVLGKVGKRALPLGPYTLVQVGVFVTSFVLLVKTHHLWAHFGMVVDSLLIMGLPCLAAWKMRRARIEGRSPLRMAAGALSYATRPRNGSAHGRRLARPGGHLVQAAYFAERRTS